MFVFWEVSLQFEIPMLFAGAESTTAYFAVSGTFDFNLLYFYVILWQTSRRSQVWTWFLSVLNNPTFQFDQGRLRSVTNFGFSFVPFLLLGNSGWLRAQRLGILTMARGMKQSFEGHQG
jgi:hypothetical protein